MVTEEFSEGDFAEMFDRLDRMWREYEDEVLKVLERWSKFRLRVLNEMSQYAGMASRLDAEIEELVVKSEIGLEDPEEVRGRVEELRRRREEIERRLEALRRFYERFERRSEEHRARVGYPGMVSGAEELRERLERLEGMRERGEVPEPLYRRLRAEMLGVLKRLGGVEAEPAPEDLEGQV